MLEIPHNKHQIFEDYQDSENTRKDCNSRPTYLPVVDNLNYQLWKCLSKQFGVYLNFVAVLHAYKCELVLIDKLVSDYSVKAFEAPH